MQSPSVLIALGPCLLMAMAAVALFVVHRFLSPARHVLVWSSAFAASAAQWGIIASSGWRGTPPFHGGIVADLTGLASMLLFVDGFRLRAAPDRWRLLLPLVGLGGAILLIATADGPHPPWRATIAPAISAAMVGWAITMVIPPIRRASMAEIAVIWMLAARALVDATAASLALAEQFGLLTSHRLYIILYLATVEPFCAAITLFTLLLIAFDFSAELKRVVHTDPLTGVLNRLGFEQALQALGKRHRSRMRPLSLAIADIDHFKSINDRFGHAAGDATLACFARHLADDTGRDVQVARIGGEEFALLLPGVDAHAAFQRVDRLRDTLDSLSVDDHPTLKVSASFGLAEREAGEPLASLIERADQALYRSKHAGRNRTTAAEAAS